jgi:hypothetical protein
MLIVNRLIVFNELMNRITNCYLLGNSSSSTTESLSECTLFFKRLNDNLSTLLNRYHYEISLLEKQLLENFLFHTESLLSSLRQYVLKKEMHVVCLDQMARELEEMLLQTKKKYNLTTSQQEKREVTTNVNFNTNTLPFKDVTTATTTTTTTATTTTTNRIAATTTSTSRVTPATPTPTPTPRTITATNETKDSIEKPSKQQLSQTQPFISSDEESLSELDEDLFEDIFLQRATAETLENTSTMVIDLTKQSEESEEENGKNNNDNKNETDDDNE